MMSVASKTATVWLDMDRDEFAAAQRQCTSFAAPARRRPLYGASGRDEPVGGEGEEFDVEVLGDPGREGFHRSRRGPHCRHGTA